MQSIDKFQRVYLIDSFYPKNYHEQYNASMILMLSSIFREVVYYVGAGQRSSIMSKIQEFGAVPNNIVWKRLRVANEMLGKKNLLKCHLKSLIYDVYLLLRIKHACLIIYNYNNPFALWAIKFINIFKCYKIILITHGELEYITDDSSIPYAWSTRIIGKFFKTSLKFRRSAKDIFCLVLGESIKKNLLEYNIINTFQIISLEHPYMFRKCQRKCDKYVIKNIGVKNVNSNYDTDKYIYMMAKKYPQFHFVIIGAPTCVHGDNIINYTQKKLRDRKEYERILSTFDMFLFLYRQSEYRLKASGAIFDAIELGIPIISLKNDYFEHLFQLHGPMGYLYNDFNSMIDDLLRISTGEAMISRILKNMERAKQYHSVPNMTILLKQKLSKILQ